VEISVRYEALEWASQQFSRAFADVGDAALSVAAACCLAASSVGDSSAGAAIASAEARVSRMLDAVCSQLLDIAGGLRSAVITYQTADRSAVGADLPPRPGRPS
jgi:hypothetical protein